jgi:hypothetical protein
MNKRTPQGFRKVLSIACMLLLVGAGALLVAQEPASAPPPASLMAPEQLDDLVAPIALYPDNLLGQVLVASTYPLEVAEAAQWLQQNRNLQGSQLVDAAREQNWDASIQALVVFPDVLNRLSSNIRWTTDLGNAFLAQQSDVMNAVQQMRARARGAGKLYSTPQETVTTETQAGQPIIEIVPANPQVVYVPAYDPEYIWGPPAWGYYPPLYYPSYGFGFGFGSGIYIGSFFGGLGWGGWGWGPNWYGGGIFLNAGFFNRYHFGGFRGGFGRDGFGRGVWEHNPDHRLGVAYPNRGLANRFASASGASFGNRGSLSTRAGQSGFTAQQRGGGFNGAARPQTNGAQAGGWHRFGEPGSGGSVAAPRNGFAAQSPNRGAGGWSHFGNAQPNVGSAPAYRGGSYNGGSLAPSYRSNPSVNGGGGGFRSAPSYGGGNYSGGRAAPSYRPSPSFGGGGGGFRAAAPSYSGGGGGFHGGGGGGGFRSGGGGGSHGGGGGSHGGGGRR